MASSGKKNKKSKGKTKTLAWNDFLQETSGTAPTVPIRKSTGNWADEVEDAYDVYDSRAKSNVVLPTAPKAARGLDDYSDKIPQNPPYSAYLSNLPYDVSEEEIADFFDNLRIAHMRIPKDERPGEMPKLKGFGYIEFEDRESLVGALAMPDCTLKNRRIRIEVATNSDNDRRRGGRMEMNRDRPDRPDTFTGDWRSGPRADPVESDRRGGGGGFSRDREAGGFSRDREAGGFSRDREAGGFSRDREAGGFSRDREAPSERDKPGAWRDSDRSSFRDSDKDRSFNRDFDRDKGGLNRDNDRGSGRDNDRGRFGDRGFGSRRNDRDDRNGGFTRGGGNRDDAGFDKGEARTRPKLVLAPRTKPLDTPPVKEEEPSNSPTRVTTSVPAASIFGSAKPVDTSARERQIEERLAKGTQKSSDSSVDRGREIRRDDVKSDDSTRRSPRRISPDRKNSPRRYSPDRRRRSIDRKSPDRKWSPKRSSERRHSPDRRTPARKWTPNRKNSSDRYSPDERSPSPDHRKSSQSPIRRKASPSPVFRKESPESVKISPNNKSASPELQKGPPKRNVADDKDKKHHKNEKALPKDKDRGEKAKFRDQEREMPKLKEPEPPNFAASNKYAFLQSEEDSD